MSGIEQYLLEDPSIDSILLTDISNIYLPDKLSPCFTSPEPVKEGTEHDTGARGARPKNSVSLHKRYLDAVPQPLRPNKRRVAPKPKAHTPRGQQRTAGYSGSSLALAGALESQRLGLWPCSTAFGEGIPEKICWTGVNPRWLDVIDST